jgi:hypothetical protein
MIVTMRTLDKIAADSRWLKEYFCRGRICKITQICSQEYRQLQIDKVENGKNLTGITSLVLPLVPRQSLSSPPLTAIRNKDNRLKQKKSRSH